MESQKDDDVNALEGSSTPEAGAAQTPTPEEPKKNEGLGKKVQGLTSRLNIYLLAFILIIILVAGFTFISIQNNKKVTTTTIDTQELTPEELAQLQNSDSTVGDPKQTLSVESNTVFNGKVLVRDNLDVAGTVKIGGALSIPGITVSGTSNLDQIQANGLALSGDASLQGQLSVQRNLTVSGSASFGGAISAPQITVQSFQLNGDLQLNRHIDAGGGTPGSSNGNALGGGGTASVSGTDTAGTVTINTGSASPPGCFVTINFAQAFRSTPHVVITPNDSDGASLNYYVTRNTNSFSICTTSNPPDFANFGFDYIAID